MKRIFFVLALLLSMPCAAQMYKCVDKKGVTHYTDAPLPGCKGGEVDIGPLPSVSGAQTPRREEDFARQEADFRRRQNERAQAEASLRATLETRCRALRLEHDRLSSGRPLARIDADGERVYLPDELKDERLAQVRDAMRACP
jgi:hypothetical protein